MAKSRSLGVFEQQQKQQQVEGGPPTECGFLGNNVVTYNLAIVLYARDSQFILCIEQFAKMTSDYDNDIGCD